MKQFNFPTVSLSYSDPDAASREPVYTSSHASRIIEDLFKDCIQLHEEVYIMLFNRAGKYLGSYCIGRGGLAEVSVNIQGALQAAILSNSSACMLTHNHPSGNKMPSAFDDKITEKIKKALLLFDVILLDHIIAIEGGCYSYADEGRL